MEQGARTGKKGAGSRSREKELGSREQGAGSIMLVIRKVEAEDHEEVLDLLRTDFYPHEPCAVGLDLCPPGYRSTLTHTCSNFG